MSLRFDSLLAPRFLSVVGGGAVDLQTAGSQGHRELPDVLTTLNHSLWEGEQLYSARNNVKLCWYRFFLRVAPQSLTRNDSANLKLHLAVSKSSGWENGRK